jgi:hypothetical protein
MDLTFPVHLCCIKFLGAGVNDCTAERVRNKIAAWPLNLRRLFVMKRIFSSLAVSVLFLMVVSASAADKATVNGWVSDTQCGAKGASAEHVACTKKCLGKGAKLAVVTDGDKKVLTVDNPEALKGHEGHHVAVTGDVTGDTIHVDSATML